MKRNHLLLLVLIAVAGLGCSIQPAYGDPLIHQTEAARYGLTRAWFAQAQVDASRGALKDVILHEGVLFVQTDQATVEAIDAETGKSLWVVQLGSPGLSTVTPSLSHRLVVVINGMDLYVLNRYNGKVLWKTKLDAAPGAAPSVSQQWLVVPLINGKIVAYRLEPLKPKTANLGIVRQEPLTPEEIAAQEKARRESFQLKPPGGTPLLCSTPGRAMVQPLVLQESAREESFAWSTDQGYMCVARINRTRGKSIELMYRLRTEAPIVTQPCYLPPNPAVLGDSGVIYGVSQDGFVHAIRERDGEDLWRFSTGGPIVENPVLVGPYLFVSNQLGGMYCLRAKELTQVWWAPDVFRFVAASKQRVYAADKLGQIRVLNAPTGTPVATIPTEMLPIKVVNADTDRLYLATKTGLIQCLHEMELSQAVVRRAPAQEPDELADATPAEKAGEAKPSEEKPAPAIPRASSSTGSRPSTAKSSKSSSKAKGGTGSSAGMYQDTMGVGTGKRTSRRGSRGPSSGGYPADYPGMQGPGTGKGKKAGGRVPPVES